MTSVIIGPSYICFNVHHITFLVESIKSMKLKLTCKLYLFPMKNGPLNFAIQDCIYTENYVDKYLTTFQLIDA